MRKKIPSVGTFTVTRQGNQRSTCVFGETEGDQSDRVCLSGDPDHAAVCLGQGLPFSDPRSVLYNGYDSSLLSLSSSGLWFGSKPSRLSFKCLLYAKQYVISLFLLTPSLPGDKVGCCWILRRRQRLRRWLGMQAQGREGSGGLGQAGLTQL